MNARSINLQIFLNRIIIALLFFTPVLYIGIGSKFPWLILGDHGVAIGMMFFFIVCVILLLFVCLYKLENITDKLLQVMFYCNFILSGIFVVAYDYINYKHFFRFGYTNPHLLYFFDVILIIIGLIFYVQKLPLHKLFLFTALISVLHFLISIGYFNLTVERSDMLIAILGSLHNFFIGLDPYVKASQVVGIPLYLPFTMISYIPSYIFGIDFRYMSIVYWIITLWLIYLNFNKLEKSSQLFIILLIINPYWLMRHELYLQIFILELVIIVFYIKRLGFIAQMLLLSIFITTLQFAWILYIFILLYICNTNKKLILMLFSNIIISIIIIWFYTHGHIISFLNAVFLHKAYLTSYKTDITLCFSTIFYFFHDQSILYFLQVLGCFVMLIYAIINKIAHKNNSYNYIYLSAICYLYFLMTNYFVETYLQMPMWVLLCLVNQKEYN